MNFNNLKLFILTPQGKIILFIVIVAVLLIMFIAPISHQNPEYIQKLESKTSKATVSPSIVSVTGSAEDYFNPDMAELSFAVVNQSTTTEAALKENNLNSEKLIAALKHKCELKSENIQTSGYSVSPVWSERPKNADTSWHSSIIAYKVANTITVKTEKLDKLGNIIAVSVNSGANTVSTPIFSISDKESAQKQVINSAFNNGKEYASTIAKSAGLKLKKLVKASLQSVYWKSNSNRSSFMMLKADNGSNASIPTIEQGKIKLTANINMEYELAK